MAYDPADPLGWKQIAAALQGNQGYGNVNPMGVPNYEVQGKPGGGALPYDIGTYNAVNTGYYHDMQNIFSPELALMGAANGMQTWDPSQFVDQEPAVPQPVPYTPTLDSLRADPVGKNVADMIDMNASPSQIRAAIRKKIQEGAIDEDMGKDLIGDADSARKEYIDSQQKLNEYQAKVASTPAKPSAMQKFAAESGLPDPLATYAPDDIDEPESMETARRKMAADKTLQRAQYLLQTADKREQMSTDTQMNENSIFGTQLGMSSLLDPRKRVADPTKDAALMKSDPQRWNVEKLMRHAFGANDLRKVDPSLTTDSFQGAFSPVVGKDQDLQQAFADPKYVDKMDARKRVATNPSQPLKDARKRRKEAEALAKLAHQEMTDADDNHNATKAYLAAKRTQQGQTPFSDAMKQRQALYGMLRGG